jgi:hypothetical protein
MKRHEPRWAIRRQDMKPRKFWLHWWTPAWHDGRGPYISIGLWLFSVMRGY